MTLPAYLIERRLPKGGPDRARFVMMYGDAMADGKSDEEAREFVFGCLRMMYFYIDAGLGERIGNPGSVPVEHLGEEDP